MPNIECIHKHPFIDDHALYLLECQSFSEIVPALRLPSRHFVTLLLADFATTTREDLVAISVRMIKAGSRYFCAWGNGCKDAHLAFDLACCDFEADSDHVIITIDHNGDPIEEAIWYTLNCAHPVDPYDRDCHATLAVCVNDTSLAQVIRHAFADPVVFSENNGPTVDDETEP